MPGLVEDVEPDAVDAAIKTVIVSAAQVNMPFRQPVSAPTPTSTGAPATLRSSTPNVTYGRSSGVTRQPRRRARARHAPEARAALSEAVALFGRVGAVRELAAARALLAALDGEE